jgi:hypothetical protein
MRLINFNEYKVFLKKNYFNYKIIQELGNQILNGIFIGEDHYNYYFFRYQENKSIALPRIRVYRTLNLEKIKTYFNNNLIRNIAGVLSINNYRLYILRKNYVDDIKFSTKQKLKNIVNR